MPANQRNIPNNLLNNIQINNKNTKTRTIENCRGAQCASALRRINPKNTGITLISLVITIIILLILTGVIFRLTIKDNGIINNAEVAGEKTNKEVATEKINLKITNSQINSYTKERRMPKLQELADDFCEDNEIEYVALKSKKVASLDKIDVGDKSSIFTKLKEYPYEFEINGELQLASIDGVRVANANTVTIPKDEYDKLKNANTYSEEEIVIGTWIDGKPLYRKVINNLKCTVQINKWNNIIKISDYFDSDLSYFRVVDKYQNSLHQRLNGYWEVSGGYLKNWTLDNADSITMFIIEYTKTTD